MFTSVSILSPPPPPVPTQSMAACGHPLHGRQPDLLLHVYSTPSLDLHAALAAASTSAVPVVRLRPYSSTSDGGGGGLQPRTAVEARGLIRRHGGPARICRNMRRPIPNLQWREVCPSTRPTCEHRGLGRWPLVPRHFTSYPDRWCCSPFTGRRRRSSPTSRAGGSRSRASFPHQLLLRPRISSARGSVPVHGGDGV